MKKLLFIFSVFSLFFFILLFVIPLFIKKDKVVQFVKNEISRKIDGELIFDNEVKIHLFPNPSLTIKNIKLTNTSFFEMTALSMNISSDWVSLLNNKPKLKRIEIFRPKLDLNFNFFLISSFDNKSLRKIAYKSSSIKTDKYLEWFDYLEISDGSIEILEGKNLHKFKNVEMKFMNMERKKIDGDFFYDNISSNLSFELITDDLNKIKTRLEHNFIDKKPVSRIEGFLYPFQKPLLFEGVFNSDLVDFEEFFNFKKMFSFIENKSFLHKVSDKRKRLFPLIIRTSSEIKKIKFKNYLLENVFFKLNLENKILRIENFNAKYLNADLILNTKYDLDSKKIKGLLLIEDFNIPKEVFGETKYDIFGGTGNMTAKFDSNLKNIEVKKIINETNIQGKFFSIDSTIKGIDTKEIAKKVDSLKKFSDFFSLMKFVNPDSLSNVNEISGDFLVSKGVLKLKETIIKNENFKISSSGNYIISENYFNITNEVKLKTNVYKNLPDFQIELSGTPQNYATNFNLDEIKKFFFSSGTLKFGPLKSLKIPMKKNNSIDLEEIFKLF